MLAHGRRHHGAPAGSCPMSMATALLILILSSPPTRATWRTSSRSSSSVGRSSPRCGPRRRAPGRCGSRARSSWPSPWAGPSCSPPRARSTTTGARIISLLMVALAPDRDRPRPGPALPRGGARDGPDDVRRALHLPAAGLAVRVHLRDPRRGRLERLLRADRQRRHLRLPLLQLLDAHHHRVRRPHGRNRPGPLVRDHRAAARADLPRHRGRRDRRQPQPRRRRAQ